MPTVLEFNADAITLFQHQSRARRSSRDIADRATAAQEAIVESRALMEMFDAAFADDAVSAGGLWPAY
jgi:hypothetical protein